MSSLLRCSGLTLAPIGGSNDSGALYHLQLLCQHRSCRSGAVWRTYGAPKYRLRWLL